MKILFLSLQQVLEIHHSRIELYGGSTGVREQGLLDSAIQMPAQGFGDQFLHEFPFEMAAAYLFHLAKNHAFVDGNKRTALACCLVFLDLNGFEVSAEEYALEDLVLRTATGELSKKEIAELLAKFCEKGGA